LRADSSTSYSQPPAAKEVTHHGREQKLLIAKNAKKIRKVRKENLALDFDFDFLSALCGFSLRSLR
jgi:hypothetical protein